MDRALADAVRDDHLGAIFLDQRASLTDKGFDHLGVVRRQSHGSAC